MRALACFTAIVPAAQVGASRSARQSAPRRGGGVGAMAYRSGSGIGSVEPLMKSHPHYARRRVVGDRSAPPRRPPPPVTASSHPWAAWRGYTEASPAAPWRREASGSVASRLLARSRSPPQHRR